jgi:hypothetical protein
MYLGSGIGNLGIWFRVRAMTHRLLCCGEMFVIDVQFLVAILSDIEAGNCVNSTFVS